MKCLLFLFGFNTNRNVMQRHVLVKIRNKNYQEIASNNECKMM